MEKDDRTQTLAAHEVYSNSSSNSSAAKRVATVTATTTNENGATVLLYNNQQYYTMDDIQLMQQRQQYGRVGEHDPLTGRRGHSYCGGCCDMRRGVIVIDMLWAVWSAVWGLAVWGTLYYSDANNNYGNDYDMRAALDDAVYAEFYNNDWIYYAEIEVLILVLLTWIAMGLSIAGAMRYSMCLVGVGAVHFIGWFLYFLVLWTFTWVYDGREAVLQVPLVVGSALLAYPHVIFIREVGRGIMSAVTYEQERHCCVF